MKKRIVEEQETKTCFNWFIFLIFHVFLLCTYGERSCVIRKWHDVIEKFEGPVQIILRDEETSKKECAKPEIIYCFQENEKIEVFVLIGNSNLSDDNNNQQYLPEIHKLEHSNNWIIKPNRQTFCQRFEDEHNSSIDDN